MKEKTIFIGSAKVTFQKNDIAILSEQYDVKVLWFGTQNGINILLNWLKQLFYLLLYLRTCKAVVIWFADSHSFFPCLLGRVFRKKTLLIIGGYDAAKVPEYNYGVHLYPFRSWLARQSCKWATHILPVSEHTANQLKEHISTTDFSKIIVIPNGVSVSFFENTSIPKQNIITCIAAASDERRMKIKGVDRFVELANQFPEYECRWIGCGDEKLVPTIPPNLKIYPLLSEQECAAHLGVSKMVAQLSRQEAFGLSILEGMAAGCIPIISTGNGLEEVVPEKLAILLDYSDLQKPDLKTWLDNYDSWIKNPIVKNKIDSLSLYQRKLKFITCIDSN